MSARAAVAVAAALMSVPGCVPDEGRSDPVHTTYVRLLAAEDARPRTGRELDVLRGGTELPDELLRSSAVRALGRLEDPSVLDEIVPHLRDEDPEVRYRAADAVAQALHRTDGDAGVDPLLDAAAPEHDPEVLGVIAHALGRLSLAPADTRRVERAIVSLGRRAEADASTYLGVVLGLEEIARTGGERSLERPTEDWLQQIFYARDVREAGDAGGRIRGVALAALGHTGRVPLTMLEPALRDTYERVRHQAVRVSEPFPRDLRSELLRRGMGDPAVIVRVEAIQVIARDPRDARSCARLLAAATADQAPAVRVVAIDALGSACPELTAQLDALSDAAARLSGAGEADWHVPAHALVSLAALSQSRASRALPGFVEHANPFVRAYAARAAGLLADRARLRALASDPVDNVRTAAITELARLDGRRADPVLLEQLDRDDPWLLLTAANLLEGGSAQVEIARAALDAFHRISAPGHETLRDPRRALLSRVAEGGGPHLGSELTPYLSDYDSLVAEDVATILEGWTGRTTVASPIGVGQPHVPSVDELRELEGAAVVLHMRRGGAIEVTLLPYEATTNAYRFARLARDGALDGLTLHRWAPNFVIQGGSPGANEYAGHGSYTRDEVGLVAHWRGTVGLSTRGHDTGDGQLFVNLVDNLRLDHDYTIFGVVTAGMDVADAVLEGDVIERAEFRPAS